jgi:lipoate-protein ligase A
MPENADGWVIKTPPGDAAWNMAFDEAMVLHCGEPGGGPLLRFYSWAEKAVSFGYFQRFRDVESLASGSVLTRRCTGGGVVVHDGDWTYGLAFPTDHEWYSRSAVESYRRLHQSVADAFLELGVEARLAEECSSCGGGQCFVGHERHDVVGAEGKIAGAAQRRTRHGLLIQGSVRPPAVVERAAWEDAFGRALGYGFRPFNDREGIALTAERLRREKYSLDSFLRRR